MRISVDDILEPINHWQNAENDAQVLINTCKFNLQFEIIDLDKNSFANLIRLIKFNG